MALGSKREKTLYGIGRKRGRLHRYTIYRWIVGVLFTALIAWLPLSGTLRFDLWAGRHRWLGEPATIVEAAKAFAFPFLAVNIGIILVSRFFGRYLCGFVCPYGALSRLAEWFRWRAHGGWERALRITALFATSLLLAAITFSFWVDWRVFVEGSTLAMGIAGAFLGSMTLVLFLAIDFLGLKFCRNWCPSGVYFAVLGHETSNSVEFAHPDNCTDCHACEAVCPSDLLPRELGSAPYRDGGGFYPEALSNHALCVRCGDCVVACEGTTARFEVETPLRLGFLHEDTSKTKRDDEDENEAVTGQATGSDSEELTTPEPETAPTETRRSA